jgi:hypothetical protein
MARSGDSGKRRKPSRPAAKPAPKTSRRAADKPQKSAAKTTRAAKTAKGNDPAGKARHGVGSNGKVPARSKLPAAGREDLKSELVLIFDFGSQYAQLIARRVREQNVY